MNIRSALERAMPYLIGIGVPIGVFLASVALPVAYDLKGIVGEMKGNQAEFRMTVDTLFRDSEKKHEKSFQDINQKLDALGKQIDLLVGRAKDSETDPNTLFARAGLSQNREFSFAVVEGKYYVFPKSTDAENRLINDGFHKEAITPVFSGYVRGGLAAPASVGPPPVAPP